MVIDYILRIIIRWSSNMKKILLTILLLVICLVGFSSTAGVLADDSQPTLSMKKAVLEKGAKLKLKVSNPTGTVIWSSSNTKIAKVSQSGKISAKKAGKCKIYATMGDTVLTCKLTVYNYYSATGEYYKISGFSTLMGKLPLKKYRYGDDNPQLAALSALGKKCTVYFGLGGQGKDVILDSDNYVYVIRNLKKYAGLNPDNDFLNSLNEGYAVAKESGAVVTDQTGHKCYVTVFRESDLTAIDPFLDDDDNVDEGFFFIYYPNKKETDYDCIVIGCDEISYDNIIWQKIK